LEQYVGDATVARAALDEPAVVVAKTDWRCRARDWIRKRKVEDAEESEKTRPKLQRKSAAQWGINLDKVVHAMTGLPLETWLQPADIAARDANPYNWKYMGLCPDQGSDGVAFSHFSRYKCHANFEMWWDHGHGVWRDQDLAMADCDLRSFAHLLTVVFNLCSSPWDSSSRYHQLLESSKEYHEFMSDTCPMLNEFMFDLTKEFEMEELQFQDDFKEQIIDRMKTDWNAMYKGSGVKRCRFANLVDRAKTFIGSFTHAKIRILYYGLQDHIFTASSMRAALDQIDNKKAEVVEDGGVGVKQSNEASAVYRKANKSNVQLAAQLLSDPLTKSRIAVLHTFVEPIRHWYGSQSHELRSTFQHKEWLCKQIYGAIWCPLRECLLLFKDVSALNSIGLIVDLPPHQLELSIADPVVRSQDYIASLAFRYAFSLVARRCKRQLYLTAGWTGQQAWFLHPEAEKRSEAAARLKLQLAAFEEAKKRTEPLWKRVVSRSVFQLAPTQQLVAMLDRDAGVVSNAMQEHIRDRLLGIGHSVVSENMFNKAKKLKPPNQEQSPAEYVWQKLVDQKFASTTYNFKEPLVDEFVAAQGGLELPASIHRATLKGSPGWIRNIISSKQRADWFTANVEGMSLPFVDLDLTVEAHRSNRWADIANRLQLSHLANGSCLALARDGQPRLQQWYYSLGDVMGHAVMVWRAKVVWKGKRMISLEPDPQATMEIVCMFNDNWQAVTFEVLSPQSAAIQKKVPVAHLLANVQFSMVPENQPRPLMQEAAFNAFWKFKISALKWYCRHLGVEIPFEASLFDVLELLVKKILPKLTEEEVVRVLSKRIAIVDEAEVCMMSDDFEDLVDQQDRKEFDKEVDTMKENLKDHDKYFLAWKTKSKTLAAKKKGKAPIVFQVSGTATPIVKSKFPLGEITQERARLMCPDPALIYSDPKNGRWQVYWKDFGTRSRHWSMYGNTEALRQCLSWAWELKLSMLGLDHSSCPTEGLMVG
jgi:hypothetical protein